MSDYWIPNKVCTAVGHAWRMQHDAYATFEKCARCGAIRKPMRSRA